MTTYRGVVTSPRLDFYARSSVDGQGAYHFKHGHKNLFPPKQRPLSHVSEGEEVPIILSGIEDQINDMITDMNPFAAQTQKIKQHALATKDMPIQRQLFGAERPIEVPEIDRWQRPTFDDAEAVEDSYIFPALREYPAFTPPAIGVQPFLFPKPRNQTCHQPVSTVTGLLQDVLGVMNTIMSEQGRVEEESKMLLELVELAAIMQEEAEALIDMVDLVEEYVEEVDKVVEVDDLEDWIQNLERRHSPMSFHGTLHEREDSGVSMGEETDSGLGTLDYTESLISIKKLENEYLQQYRDVENIGSNSPASPVYKGNKTKRRATSRPRKGIWTAKPHFRDSALDVLSPVGNKR